MRGDVVVLRSSSDKIMIVSPRLLQSGLVSTSMLFENVVQNASLVVLMGKNLHFINAKTHEARLLDRENEQLPAAPGPPKPQSDCL